MSISEAFQVYAQLLYNIPLQRFTCKTESVCGCSTPVARCKRIFLSATLHCVLAVFQSAEGISLILILYKEFSILTFSINRIHYLCHFLVLCLCLLLNMVYVTTMLCDTYDSIILYRAYALNYYLSIYMLFVSPCRVIMTSFFRFEGLVKDKDYYYVHSQLELSCSLSSWFYYRLLNVIFWILVLDEVGIPHWNSVF